MSQYRPLLLVSVLALCAMLSCVTKKEDKVYISEQPALQRLVSRKLLEQARLKIQWETKLPIEATERLDRLFILGNRIYALSDHNYFVSLSRETGHEVFSRSFAPPGYTMLGLGLYKDELDKDQLISIIGNSLVEISPEFGTELRRKSLGFGVTCPAARNSSYFYLAGVDNRLRVLRAKDKVELFQVDAEKIITCIIADDDFVVFSTDAGNVTSMAPDKPNLLWRFEAGDGIVGPMVRDGESLFVASKDTYVYKLDVGQGRTPVWKYQTGGILDTSPRVTADVVYQYVHYQGLSAIDKNRGTLIWQLPEGVDLLAEADGKAYVITNAGTLVVMDNKKAKRLHSVNFASVSKYGANVTDSKIYIADEAGRITCLIPLE